MKLPGICQWCAVSALLMGSCSGEVDGGKHIHDSKDAIGVDAGVEKQKSRAFPTGSTLYTYADDLGRIHMVNSIAQIPEKYADRVVVTDMAKNRRDRLDSDLVVVLDLRKTSKGKPLNYSVLDLSSYSNKTLHQGPATNPGQLGKRLARMGVEQLRSFIGLEPERDGRGRVVILYSAPWCGFCKKAEAYLKNKHIPFVKKNIEANTEAAMELGRKLRAAGIKSGGIPVLDINGKLIVGFDKKRISSLLGDNF